MYDDIINYNYKGKKHMSLYERSAQFAPFAALVGYGEAIYESGRITSTKILLSDDEKEEINNKIKESINKEITITYFVPDKYKEGGSYINYSGTVRRIDYVYKNIIFYDKKTINIEDIIFVKYD